MFDAWCPACKVRGLYGPRSILSLRHGADGIVAVFRCHCGTVATTAFGVRRASTEGAVRSDEPRPNRSLLPGCASIDL